MGILDQIMRESLKAAEAILVDTFPEYGRKPAIEDIILVAVALFNARVGIGNERLLDTIRYP